jgi:hypothetical protein
MTICAAVYRRTEGNPLFVEALLADGQVHARFAEAIAADPAICVPPVPTRAAGRSCRHGSDL